MGLGRRPVVNEAADRSLLGLRVARSRPPPTDLWSRHARRPHRFARTHRHGAAPPPSRPTATRSTALTRGASPARRGGHRHVGSRGRNDRHRRPLTGSTPWSTSPARASRRTAGPPSRRTASATAGSKATSLLAHTLAELDDGPRCSSVGSAIGYYGSHRGDEVLTRRAAAGHDFLAAVCGRGRPPPSAAEQPGVRSATIRTGIVLSGEGRGARPSSCSRSSSVSVGPSGVGDGGVAGSASTDEVGGDPLPARPPRVAGRSTSPRRTR